LDEFLEAREDWLGFLRGGFFEEILGVFWSDFGWISDKMAGNLEKSTTPK
jgi:hypothetical protein